MIFGHLFLSFLKIGLFGFGGGIAMLPLIFQTVQTFGIMSDSDFANLVAISQVTPGPIAVNAATFVGYNAAGVLGALAATLGVVVPAFLLVLLAMRFLNRYEGTLGVEGVFDGIRPATIGLIAAAAVVMAKTVLYTAGSGFALIPCLIFLVTAALSLWGKISPILITLLMALAGVFLCH